MDRLELDVGGFRHQQTWEILAAQYNNKSEGPEFDYLNKLQVDNALYAGKNPADFDVLDARDVSQFVRWMNNQYYMGLGPRDFSSIYIQCISLNDIHIS
jgi:hypothetical protein